MNFPCCFWPALSCVALRFYGRSALQQLCSQRRSPNWWEMSTGWGPRDSVQLPHEWLNSIIFMVDITGYNHSYWTLMGFMLLECWEIHRIGWESLLVEAPWSNPSIEKWHRSKLGTLNTEHEPNIHWICLRKQNFYPEAMGFYMFLPLNMEVYFKYGPVNQSNEVWVKT